MFEVGVCFKDGFDFFFGEHIGEFFLFAGASELIDGDLFGVKVAEVEFKSVDEGVLVAPGFTRSMNVIHHEVDVILFPNVVGILFTGV